MTIALANFEIDFEIDFRPSPEPAKTFFIVSKIPSTFLSTIQLTVLSVENPEDGSSEIHGASQSTDSIS